MAKPSTEASAPGASAKGAVLTGSSSPPWLATWSRRLLSVGLIATLGCLWLGLAPLLFPVALLVDWLGGRRYATCRALLFFGLYLGCEIVGVAACAWLWLVSGIWLERGRRRFVQANFRLQVWWASALRRGAFRIFSLKVEVVGGEQVEATPLVLFVRHSSVADTVLPVMLSSAPHDTVLRWVMKKELLWDPCLDIVGHRLRNCFVSRMPSEGASDVAAVASLMDGLAPGEGVVIYPEGTRFTPAKRERLLAKLDGIARDRAAALAHVLPPRLGGALALLQHNDCGADAVFCAHSGLEGGATFSDLLRGELIGRTVRIELWRVPFASIPEDQQEQVSWLQEQWRRVDEVVGRHKNMDAAG